MEIEVTKNYSVVSQEISYKVDQETIDFSEGGNDQLICGIRNDDLKGGTGADYFDCGKGIDEILDFSAK
jgi:Ca2+-binding RTX toxin-like protein